MLKLKNMRDADTVKALKTTVRSWYIGAYPTDDLGIEIPAELTFWDVVAALNVGLDVYAVLGTARDSVVRERIFRKIADIMNVKYNVIYDLWLSAAA